MTGRRERRIAVANPATRTTPEGSAAGGERPVAPRVLGVAPAQQHPGGDEHDRRVGGEQAQSQPRRHGTGREAEERPDVAAKYGAQYGRSGFSLRVDPLQLPFGDWALEVITQSSRTGRTDTLRQSFHAIPGVNPQQDLVIEDVS